MTHGLNLFYILADINECAGPQENEEPACSDQCINTQGSFFCQCPEDKMLVGNVCKRRKGRKLKLLILRLYFSFSPTLHKVFKA